jgi:DNA-binding CsgD family transcriptional regulator
MAASDLLDLIGLMYESVENPSRWAAFLDALFSRFNSHLGGVHFFYRSSVQSVLSGTTESDQVMYRDYYGRVDPLMDRNAKLPQGLIIGASHHIIADAVFRTTEFYNDYGKRIGFDYGLGMSAKEASGKQLVLAAVRHRRHGAFTEQEVESARPLLPHLGNVLRLQEALAGAKSQRDTLLECMDQLDRGLVLIRDGRVLNCNRMAGQIAALSDGLYIDVDGVRAGLRNETLELRRAMQDALGTSNGEGLGAGGTVLVSRPSGKRPWIVSFSPYMGQPGQGMVAVLITDPDQPSLPSAEIVARLFGFTSAETRMAVILATGVRVENAAEILQIKLTTARTHLQRMLEKARVKRQTELVLLLNRIPRRTEY